MSADDAGAEPVARDVVRENVKLTKIVNALMARVERSTDAQGNAFSLFQAAITLESTVRERTAQLQSLNRRLSEEIDERRAVERALLSAKADAERANQGKTEFLAAASHDLLQPLAVARLFVNALAERRLDAETAHMVERVGRSLESADTLLHTLLEMSRLDAGALQADMRDVALDPILRRLAGEYGRPAEERGLRLRVVPCDAVVRTDRNLLERVLRNLISNALRYTRAGGVLVGVRRRAGCVRIEVWDTGRGIPAGSLSDIFREFTRLPFADIDDGAPGMGLGLAIVGRIVPLIRAAVDVRSRPGRGSVFGLTVPLAGVELPALAAHAPQHAPGAEAFRDRTVLVVDADLAAIETVCTILRGWGMRPIAACCVDDGVAFLRAQYLRPAVIVADYYLANGATGFDAIEAVRASFAYPGIPAIIVTADPGEAVRRRAADRGFGYLNKPLRIERLRSLLAHVLAPVA